MSSLKYSIILLLTCAILVRSKEISTDDKKNEKRGVSDLIGNINNKGDDLNGHADSFTNIKTHEYGVKEDIDEDFNQKIAENLALNNLQNDKKFATTFNENQFDNNKYYGNELSTSSQLKFQLNEGKLTNGLTNDLTEGNVHLNEENYKTTGTNFALSEDNHQLNQGSYGLHGASYGLTEGNHGLYGATYGLSAASHGLSAANYGQSGVSHGLTGGNFEFNGKNLGLNGGNLGLNGGNLGLNGGNLGLNGGNLDVTGGNVAINRGATVTTINRAVPVPVPQPYPVTVNRAVPFPVPQAVPVNVPRPVAVAVPVPRPVPVLRPFPVTVTRRVPVIVPQRIAVPVAQPVGVPVPQPYPVTIPQAVPVRVPQTVVVPVAQPIYVNGGAGNGINNGLQGGNAYRYFANGFEGNSFGAGYGHNVGSFNDANKFGEYNLKAGFEGQQGLNGHDFKNVNVGGYNNAGNSYQYNSYDQKTYGLPEAQNNNLDSYKNLENLSSGSYDLNAVKEHGKFENGHIKFENDNKGYSTSTYGQGASSYSSIKFGSKY